MPMRDGGDIQFGVRITADGSVFLDGVRAATNATKEFNETLKQGGAAAEGAGKQHESMATSVFKGAAAVEIARKGLESLVEVYGSVIEHTAAAQQSQARVEAVLRATGATSGVTAETVGHLASEMQRLTQFDDTQIKDASATLATFGNVGEQSFGRIIKLAADLAATGRGDLQSWVEILGKLGSQPVASLGALERAVGKLSPALKATAQSFAEVGDQQSALNISLAELEKRVGGTAQDSYRGLTKTVGDTHKAYDELLRAVGNKIFDAQSRDANYLAQNLEAAAKAVEHYTLSWKTLFAITVGFAKGGPLGAMYELALNDPNARPLTGPVGPNVAYGKINYLPPAPDTPSAPAAPIFTPSQQAALDGQRIELRKQYNDHMQQLRSEDAQHEMTLAQYQHEQLLISDSSYYAAVESGEQKQWQARLDGLRRSLAAEQSLLAIANQMEANAQKAFNAGTGTSDAALAAKMKVAEVSAKIAQINVDIAAQEERAGDAAAKRSASQEQDDLKHKKNLLDIDASEENFQRSIDRTLGALQEEADLIGKTDEEVRQGNEARALTVTYTEQLVQLQQKLKLLSVDPLNNAAEIAKTTKDIANLPDKMQEALEKSKNLISQIFSRKRSAELWGGLVGALQDGFQAAWGQIGNGWKKAIEAFKTTFEHDFLQWLYQQFAKPIFLNVVAGVTGAMGMSGVAQAATTAAGGNTLGSAAGSALGGAVNTAAGAYLAGGGAGGFTGAFSAGYTANAAYLAGSAEMAPVYGTVAGEMGGAAAGIAEGITSVLSAIPVWGWIALAVIAIAAYFGGKGGGPKFGGSAGGSYGPDGQFVGNFTDPLTDNGRLFTPDQMDPALRKVTDATAMGYYSTLASLGGHTAGMSFEIGADNDPQGTAQSRVSGRVFDAKGNLIYNNVDKSMDDKDVPAAIALEIQREILAAIQHSDLGDKTMEGIFKSVVPETATKEQMTTVMQLAQAYQTLKDTIASVDMTPAEKISHSIELMNRAVTSADEGFNGALRTGDNDKILAAENQLYTAVMNRYNAEIQMVQQLAAQVRQIEEASYQFSISIAQKIVSVGGKADVPAIALGRATDLRTRVNAGAGTAADRLQDVQSYVGAVDTWYQSRVSQINADAQKQAAQLNSYYQGMAASAQSVADSLQKQLDLANAWKDVLGQAQSMIDNMRLSSANPLGIIGRTQMAASDVEAMLGRYNAASGQGRVDLAKQLMDALKTYQGLGQEAFQRPSDAYTGVYNEIMRDLAQIQSDAKGPADKALDLQQQILDEQQKANMWGSMTANAADIAQSELDSLNTEAQGYYEWARTNGEALFQQAHKDAVDQLNAVTGGQDVNLFIAGLNKDMLATLKSIDARLAKQYAGGGNTTPGDTTPGAAGTSPGGDSTGGNALARGSTLNIYVQPGQDIVDAVSAKRTVIKRMLDNA